MRQPILPRRAWRIAIENTRLLNELQEWGAVKKAWVPGERKEYFEAVELLQRLNDAIIREQPGTISLAEAERQMTKESGLLGLSGVVVTRGDAGAIFRDGNGRETAVPPPGRARRIVDTVGAGDAFAAVMILGSLRGWDPEATIRMIVSSLSSWSSFRVAKMTASSARAERQRYSRIRASAPRVSARLASGRVCR